MRHGERGNRSSQPGQDPSGADQVLDALLAGWPLPDEDQAGLQPVADVLAALRRPATAAELTGQASALAVFHAQPHRTGAAARPRRRRGPAMGTLLRPGPAVLFAGAAVLAGLAVGGYAGDLPAPVQQWAHHTFGLTAARTNPAATPGHPARGSRAPATPRPGPGHSRPGAARRQPDYGQPRPGARHQRDGRNDRRAARPAGGEPSSGWNGWPAPGGQGTPGASGAPSPKSSTSPAAQPSTQPSTAPAPHPPYQPGGGVPGPPP